MSVSSRFDSAALDLLKRVGTERLVDKMTGMFEAGAPQKLVAARLALAAEDCAAFALAMHSLKSSAGQLGAKGLESICAELERTTPDTETKSFILRKLDLAETEMNDAIVWMKQCTAPARGTE